MKIKAKSHEKHIKSHENHAKSDEKKIIWKSTKNHMKKQIESYDNQIKNHMKKK